MSNNLSKRLIKGISANILSQGVSVLIQFVSVPLFLKYWGVQMYGQWLLLYALPAYLTFVDLGFGVTSSTEIAKAVNKDDYESALEIFQSTLFITVSLGTTMILLCSSCLLLNLKSFLNITLFSTSEVNYSFIFLALYVILSQQIGVFTGLYNFYNKYHFVTTFYSFYRLAEFGTTVLIVIFSKSILTLSIALCSLKLIQVCFFAWDTKRYVPWVVFGIAKRKLSYIRKLLIPSTSLLLYPICLSILNQGVSILIGKNLGSASLVLFSTLRTFTNSIKMFTQQYNNLLYSELVKFFASQKIADAIKLFRKSILGTSVFVIVIGIGFMIFGPAFVKFWTKGKLSDFSPVVLLLFIIEAFTYNLWHTLYQAYQSQNRHAVLSVCYLIASLLIVFITGLGVKTFSFESYLVLISVFYLGIYLFFHKKVFMLQTNDPFVENMATGEIIQEPIKL